MKMKRALQILLILFVLSYWFPVLAQVLIGFNIAYIMLVLYGYELQQERKKLANKEDSI
jgi:hypothetical protein